MRLCFAALFAMFGSALSQDFPPHLDPFPIHTGPPGPMEPPLTFPPMEEIMPSGPMPLHPMPGPSGTSTGPGSASGQARTAEFTLAQVLAMKEGMDNQNHFYNYTGHQVLSGAPNILTTNMLTMLLDQFNLQGPTNLADLPEPMLRNMRERLMRGETLDLQGVTLEQLDKVLNAVNKKATEVVFYLHDVERMIDGMLNFNKRYNYTGHEIKQGSIEEPLTIAQLRTMQRQLNSTGVVEETADFTLADVLRMLAGVRSISNIRYNFKGQVAQPNETRILTEPLLLKLYDQLKSPTDPAVPGATSPGAATNLLNAMLSGRAMDAVHTATGGAGQPMGPSAAGTPGTGTADSGAPISIGAPILIGNTGFNPRTSRDGSAPVDAAAIIDPGTAMEIGGPSRGPSDGQGGATGAGGAEVMTGGISGLGRLTIEPGAPGGTGQGTGGFGGQGGAGTEEFGVQGGAEATGFGGQSGAGTREFGGPTGAGATAFGGQGGAGTWAGTGTGSGTEGFAGSFSTGTGAIDIGAPDGTGVGAGAGNVDGPGNTGAGGVVGPDGTVSFGGPDGARTGARTGGFGGSTINFGGPDGTVDFGGPDSAGAGTGAGGFDGQAGPGAGAVAGSFGGPDGTVVFGGPDGNVAFGGPADTGTGAGAGNFGGSDGAGGGTGAGSFSGPDGTWGETGAGGFDGPSASGIGAIDIGVPDGTGAGGQEFGGQGGAAADSVGGQGGTVATGFGGQGGTGTGEFGGPASAGATGFGGQGGAVTGAGGFDGQAGAGTGAGGFAGQDGTGTVDFGGRGGAGAGATGDATGGFSPDAAINMLENVLAGRENMASTGTADITGSGVVDLNPVAKDAGSMSGGDGLRSSMTGGQGTRMTGGLGTGMTGGAGIRSGVTRVQGSASATGGFGGASIIIPGGSGMTRGAGVTRGADTRSGVTRGQGSASATAGFGGASITIPGGSGMTRGAGRGSGMTVGEGFGMTGGQGTGVTRVAGTISGVTRGQGSASATAGFGGASITIPGESGMTGGAVRGSGMTGTGGQGTGMTGRAGTRSGVTRGQGSAGATRGFGGTSIRIPGGSGMTGGAVRGSGMAGGQGTGMAVGQGTGMAVGQETGMTGGAGTGFAGSSVTIPGGRSRFPQIDTTDFFTNTGRNVDLGAEPFAEGLFTKDGNFIGAIGEEWKRARLDPGICTAGQCTGPICYLPYRADCKNYVVCQRTAIGTYVAWKMRCAFGSYWREGSAWTCERVDHLLKEGYKCPNDPCRAGKLMQYADEDARYCRSYWKCVEGVSEPACCKDGWTFDRKRVTCVRDPTATCRLPCPLKRQGCSVPGRANAPFYDGNCRTYWACENGHPHPVCCKSGMFYNTSIDDCDSDRNLVCQDSCPTDYNTPSCGVKVGGRVVTSYALDDGNCRTFMKCNNEIYGDAFCCKQKHRYDVTKRVCVPVEDPLDVCSEELCPSGYMEECRFSPVLGFANKFQDRSINITFDCAPGTYFDAPICTCNTLNYTDEICNSRETWVKFDETNNLWGVKNHGGSGSITPYGNLMKNSTIEGITYGQFNGADGITVWPYTQTVFPTVNMRVHFQHVPPVNERTGAPLPPKPQVIASNCRSSSGAGPSYQVVLNPKSGAIELTAVTATETARLRVPYIPDGWNQVVVMFDGHNIVLTNQDAMGLQDIFKASAPLDGSILASEKALRFGPCLDDKPADDGFTGYISEIVFSKCLDGAGRGNLNNILASMPASAP